MHPFDLKSALLARHAQHVALVHFPIALFLTGVLFDCVARWKQSRPLAAAAYYNLLVAALSSLPVVATGVLAWQWQLEGQRFKGTLLLHLILGVTSSVLIWLVWWGHFRGRKSGANGGQRYLLAVELLASATVALTAHLGGFLSGVNGP